MTRIYDMETDSWNTNLSKIPASLSVPICTSGIVQDETLVAVAGGRHSWTEMDWVISQIKNIIKK